MATQRADGYPHLTPIWFVWEDGKFLHTLGANRVHLANLARDPRMSLVIDEDYRLADGLAAGARSITVRGDAELSQDPGADPRRDLQGARQVPRRGGREAVH